ncbi:pyridoxamine 5'-phosphate oxidase family protein [Acidovorax sp. NB1]|uniref:pyridoxamine 5'-phosphate oxidase family protein n=1 Tax=Acidovorax sp. NB1 TaxID=1943571 RepID=UPI0010D9E30B|nr:pyridoxamine 5'-phosphate oxidase family protein [Acidovorax sp. NB1]GDY38658.1 pyridoxamine 5'-phosphate oxidase [Acidovorax sp. NB1]
MTALPAGGSEGPTPSAWHAGEQALQARAGVHERMAAVGEVVMRDHMPDQHRELFEKLPTLLLGALDAQGQPWATMLAGPPGFVHTPHAQRMDIAAAIDPADPALAALAAHGTGAPVGVLGLEPHTRRRNRMNGHVVRWGAQQGLSITVAQSFGNCPKYIQARAPGLRAAVTPPQPAQPLGQSLDAAALTLIARSDTLFIASASAARPGVQRGEGVDISHRGGEPGFVLAKHTAEGLELWLPDYPGNLFFNTLGNLAQHPLAGLLWVDYEDGGLLHVAARAELLWGETDRAPWPGAQRVLRLQVLGGVWRAQALPWRWTAAQPAPQFSAMRQAATAAPAAPGA